MYTPFLKPRKAPEVNGVYRNIHTKNIMVLKNMTLRGFIDANTHQPYDAYIGTIMTEKGGVMKRCMILPSDLTNCFEKLFSL